VIPFAYWEKAIQQAKQSRLIFIKSGWLSGLKTTVKVKANGIRRGEYPWG